MKRLLAKVLKWIIIGLGSLLLLLLVAVSGFGVLRSGTDLQYAAQLLLEFFGPLILLVLALATCGLSWRYWQARRRFTLIMASIAGTGMILCAVTLGGYVGAARKHGVSINFARALWPSLPSDGGRTAQPYVYDEFDGQDIKLLVYRPAGHHRSAPILVHIHGGGWVQGSKEERSVDARWFADIGYLVVDLDYSLSSDRRHLWNVTHSQLGCGLSWIAQNAQRLGGDPNRIAIYGESAGGNLVLNLGHLANAGALISLCGGEVPRISAVISIYPPVDMPALYAHAVSTIYPKTYTGGSPAQFPDRYAVVSPMTYVRGPGAPTLLLTGLDDSLVPVSDTLRYVQLRQSAGHEISLIAIPRAGHAFDALPGSIGNQIFRKSTVAFLKKHNLQP